MSVFADMAVVRSRDLVGRVFAIDEIYWRTGPEGPACTIELTLDNDDGPQVRWLPSSGVSRWLHNRKVECEEKGESLVDPDEWLTLDVINLYDGKIRYLIRPADFQLRHQRSKEVE